MLNERENDSLFINEEDNITFDSNRRFLVKRHIFVWKPKTFECEKEIHVAIVKLSLRIRKRDRQKYK